MNNTITRVTPTEALLHVVKQSPSLLAVRHGKREWSYGALWERICQIARLIDQSDDSGGPVGLHMGLEVDYVATAHAIWLAGRTAVILGPEMTPSELRAVSVQTNLRLVLYGQSAPDMKATCLSTLDLVGQGPSRNRSSALPAFSENVTRVPVVSCIIPSTGDHGTCVIGQPMRDCVCNVPSNALPTLLEVEEGLWLDVLLLELSSQLFPAISTGLELDADQNHHITEPGNVPTFIKNLDWAHGFDEPEAHFSIGDDVFEIAIAISEEVAFLSHASGPVPTDMPLVLANMDFDALAELHSWLQACYEWDKDFSTLFDQDLTAQTLAQYIVGIPSLGSCHAEIDILLDENLQALSAISPGRQVDSFSLDAVRSRSSPRVATNATEVPSEIPLRRELKKKRGRLAPKTQIRVNIQADSEQESFESVPSTILYPSQDPAPESATKYLKGLIDLDIGMASFESWSGRKAGMVVGLLALGTVLTSPMSNSFHQIASHKPSLSFGAHPTPLDIRSPVAGRTSILSPWLDAVHLHGLEPIQSPWVADFPHGGVRGDDAHLRFPQSPCAFF